MTPPSPHTITYDELVDQDRGRAQPAFVTGIDVLPELWTPGYVLDEVGATRVPIVHISNGDYVGGELRERTVADYYAEVTGDLPSDHIPYLAELSYDEHFPTLAAQLVDPPALQGERFVARVMYFGRGVHSQIHFHTGGSAMLFCIHGTKVVRLYGPDQTPKLYKVPGRNFSRVLVSSVGENSYVYDRERFPSFAEAEYVEYEVRAGQVLFIPMHWWHSIQNLHEISLTAVYFWDRAWKNSWRDFVPPELPPAGMRLDYVRNLAYRYAINPLRGLVRR
jgi:quercetin dioxygenase-like cupin family protein